MKAFRALLLAVTLSGPVLQAQDTPAPAAPSEPVSPAPAAEKLPSAASSTTDLTPAKDVPVTPPPAQPVPPADLMPAQELPTPSPTPDATLTPEIPSGTTEKPKGTAIEQPKGEKKSKTEAAADALDIQVRLRKAKTRAIKDPEAQALWDNSLTAKTDWEKRDSLKRYYRIVYARMEKFEPKLKKEIEERRAFSLRRLEQNRIQPTEVPYYVTVIPDRSATAEKPARKRR
jgi:hypothetical protein